MDYSSTNKLRPLSVAALHRNSPSDRLTITALRVGKGAPFMIGLLLVDGTNRVDVDTNEEDYSEKDIN